MDCMAKIKDNFDPSKLDRIEVSYSRKDRRHHIWDGNHRYVAVGELGFDYILGSVPYNYDCVGKPYDVHAARRIGHTEHERLIAQRNGAPPPVYGCTHPDDDSDD